MSAKTQRIAHPWITVLIGAIALSAWAGVAGLATGALDLGATITARLPFQSGALAAIALCVVVAAPMSLAAWLCGSNNPQWRNVAAVAGALLVGWIVVQVAIIQTFSWLQPAMAAAGVAVLICAVVHRRERT